MTEQKIIPLSVEFSVALIDDIQDTSRIQTIDGDGRTISYVIDVSAAPDGPIALIRFLADDEEHAQALQAKLDRAEELERAA